MARKHKPFKVGDQVGGSRIVKELDRDPIGRRRFMAKCRCGTIRTGMECDFRRSPLCRSCAAKERAQNVSGP